jgi:hypothetical protein
MVTHSRSAMPVSVQGRWMNPPFFFARLFSFFKKGIQGLEIR